MLFGYAITAHSAEKKITREEAEKYVLSEATRSAIRKTVKPFNNECARSLLQLDTLRILHQHYVHQRHAIPFEQKRDVVQAIDNLIQQCPGDFNAQAKAAVSLVTDQDLIRSRECVRWPLFKGGSTESPLVYLGDFEYPLSLQNGQVSGCPADIARIDAARELERPLLYAMRLNRELQNMKSVQN